jgi:hypothetical protein
VLRIHPDDQRLRGEVGKKNSLSGNVVAHEEALFAEDRVWQRVLTAIRAFFNSRSRTFVNNPG